MYAVVGTAHGDAFNERGFETWEEARDYASEVICGDLDGTVEVIADGLGVENA